MDYTLRWEETIQKIYSLPVEYLCWFRHPLKFYGFAHNTTLYTYTNNVLAGYYSMLDMERNSKLSYDFYQNKKNLDKVVNSILTEDTKNKKYVKKIAKINLNTATNKKLIEILKINQEMFLNALGLHYLSMPWVFLDIGNHIKKELRDLGVKEVEKIFLDLTANTKPSIIEKSDIKLLENNARVQERIKKHLNLSEKTLHFVKVIKDLSWHRLNHTRIFWTNCQNIEYKIFDIICKRIKVTPNQLKLCLPKDVFNILKNNKITEGLSQELKNRNDFFLLKTNNKECEIYSGKNARNIFVEMVSEKDYNSLTEVKGVPANIGTIRGKARVFKNETFELKKCLFEMKKGEILIIQNTWPELLPICAKASAIVTNEGGICSHGAVVSREFNIPCVVGTIVATKVFKTGDIVEVDGEKGLIKKI